MSWLSVLLFAGLLLPISRAFGQVPAIESPVNKTDPASIVQLLSSTEPSQLAWGSYHAANSQQRSAIPAIIPLLRSSNALVQLAAIDALIRLDATVPDEDLAFFLLSNRAAPVIVLLASDPKTHGDFLLRLLGHASNPEWVAVNSILLTAPPPGYTARLLREWTLQFNLNVWDKPFRAEGCCCGWFTYPPFRSPSSGFPPIYQYVVEEGTPSGSFVIAAGVHPVAYARQESVPRSGPCVPKDAYRLDYLKVLARVGPDNTAGQLPDVSRGFQWIGAAKYEADSQALLTGIRSAVAFIRRALVERGLLTAEEASLGPTLKVQVIDHRTEHHDPLPAIDWRLDR